MRTGRYIPTVAFFFCYCSLFTATFASAVLPRGVDVARSLLDSEFPALNTRGADSPQPQSQSHPAARSIAPLTNKAYLPAQIGGIVGSYALCLIVVAFTLLVLSKQRREHLESGDELEFYQQTIINHLPETFQLQDSVVPYAVKTPAHANFSYPALASPTAKSNFSGIENSAAGSQRAPCISTSYASSFRAPGVDPSVDQEIVSADRDMAQSQLEEMYKYVMEQEEAKANGVVLEDPPAPLSALSSSSRNNPFGANSNSSLGNINGKHQKDVSNASTATLLRKEKSKPMSLNLSLGSGKDKDERTSRTSSILSALKSPRKKKMQGMSISSPIMTPMSGTFPRAIGEAEEMNPIPPRQYAPAAPPPVPAFDPQMAVGRTQHQSQYQQYHNQYQQPQHPVQGAPMTPDISPLSTLSIDERIGAAIVTTNLHTRDASTLTFTTEADPESAISADSSAPLVGLPTSPKPGVTRFPSLPASPRATSFSRPNAPTAVRTGGALPLRAYEPSLASPSYATHGQTKQTVFERSMPLSPGAQTPWTGAPVPYSPYQPFSPVVPITPSLVTKADRKRMKRYEPKTPTVEMVRSIDDTW